jgi:hypothetical protein
VRCRAGAFVASLGWLVLLTAAKAADKPDPALLEFLGSVDTEDKDWHAYLAHTDIEQVAKRAAAARGNPAPVPPPPAAASVPPKSTPASSAAPINPPAVSHP